MHPQNSTARPLRVCETCGRTFSCKTNSRRPMKFCSLSCYWAPRPLLLHPDDPEALIVPLTRGKVAIIDRTDAPLVAPYRWTAICYDGRWYARRSRRVSEGQGEVFLHQQLFPVLPGWTVDHVDGDGLNCRRENLRQANHSENQCNKPAYRTNKSGYKGVDWDSHHGKWRAQIAKDGRHYHLGRFDTAEEAARAYDAAARRLHGAFARVNFPDDAQS